MAPRRSPRLHPQTQASEGGAAVTRRRSPRLHPQTQANNEDGAGVTRRRSPRLHPQPAPHPAARRCIPRRVEDGARVTRRRRGTSLPPVHTLPDDLLWDILLRLPPQPSTLPRASAVCKRWQGLVTDPGFSRRFRLRHRQNPPLLGFFRKMRCPSFVSTLDAPNCIPAERFSLQPDNNYSTFGCRHGLYLISFWRPHPLLVWDPITGDKHHIAFPAPFDTFNRVHGAVLRDAEDVQHFKVVMAGEDVSNSKLVRAFTCVYSSKTSVWGNLISTPIPYKDTGSFRPSGSDAQGDAVLAGNCLYWRLAWKFHGILEFDLVKQSLAVIEVPLDICDHQDECECFSIMRAEGGGLGLLQVSKSDCTVQLWKRKTDCDGVASWELTRTIELDKLLSLKPEEKGGELFVRGIAEENNVLFLWTMIGLFMIHLKSLKFKNLFKSKAAIPFHPFESVYAAGACADGGQDGAGLLLNA